MSNVQVQFKRGDTNTLNNTQPIDGMIYFNIENQHIYMYNGSNRLEYSNNMSNFMDKTTIANLADKSFNSTNLMRYDTVDNVIGNTNIGNVDALHAIDELYQNKSLFTPVWSNNTHQPFTSMSINTNGIYPFYIISFGSYVDVYDEDDPSVIIDTVWKQNDENFDSLSSYYIIALNDNVVYTKKGCFDGNNIVDDARRIQITSDSGNNTTTFIINRYGQYFNGSLVHAESSDNNKDIPIYIMGITAL